MREGMPIAQQWDVESKQQVSFIYHICGDDAKINNEVEF